MDNFAPVGTLAELSVASLICFRLWRLIARDSILDRGRDIMPGFVKAGLACPWCSSVWVALVLVFVAEGFTRWRVVLDVILIATVAGILAAIMDRVDSDG